MKGIIISIVAIFALTLSACVTQPVAAPENGSQAEAESASLRVLAANSFLADIAQNVAGDRVRVDSLIPLGVDPHAFEPTPQDVAKIADSQLFIINGAGFEEWLERTIANAGGQGLIVEAAHGLEMRATGHAGEEHDEDGHHHAGDPHFWLDPNQVITYVENIRNGLSEVDPAGREIYAQNGAAYIEQLRELDAWIRTQVEQIPRERRILVTDHDTLGYFADQYGFSVTGAIIPGFSTGASPSAQELASLIDQIQQAGAPAIFLDVTANPRLAAQIADETSITVVGDLYTHSVTEASGPAPTYIKMMRHNTLRIVEALK